MVGVSLQLAGLADHMGFPVKVSDVLGCGLRLSTHEGRELHASEYCHQGPLRLVVHIADPHRGQTHRSGVAELQLSLRVHGLDFGFHGIVLSVAGRLSSRSMY